MMATIKIGFVGAGGNATGHMKRVNDIEAADIVAVCDIDKERAEQAAGQFDAKAYCDHHDMLDSERLDALYVSVPPFAHTDAEILAARKGIHLFVEKPVALSMEKGCEVCDEIEKTGIISCVGYQVRYVDSSDRAKEWLADKTVAMVSCARWGGVPPTSWWSVMAKSGGQIVEQTTHQVDMMRYLVGEIVAVHAYYALRTLADRENFDIPDVMATALKFENGAVGILTSSCAMTSGGGKSELDIMVKEAVLRWSAGGVTVVPGEHPELAGEPRPTPSIDEVFVDAVVRNDPSSIRSPYLDGLKSLGVTLAMNESASTGNPVVPHFAR